MQEFSPAGEITRLLHEWSNGNREAWNDLVTIVYDELHQQAHRYLRRERRNHTLQTTALLHETFIKLAGQRRVEWENRGHFFWLSSEIMRRILVDYAKNKNRQKRGGKIEFEQLTSGLYIAVGEMEVDLLALDQALTRLAELDEQQAKIVELRYFSGLSIEETAEALKISPATVKRDWNMAKAWLHRELSLGANQ